MSFTSFFPNRRRHVFAGAALLCIGAGVGAVVMHEVQPVRAMAPIAPVRIAALGRIVQPWLGETMASVRGRVVEVFGDRFVVDDGSGRALVEVGDVPAGLVATGQTVTIQGRVVPGGLRARFVVGADGRVTAVGHGGRHGHRGRHGHGAGELDGAPDDNPERASPAAPTPALR